MPNMSIVREFLASWNARDLDRIMKALAPDAFYHNIPMEPLRGHAAIREALLPFVAGASEIEWTLHDIAESVTGAVLTERTDTFLMSGRKRVIRVMGIFELRDGLIQSWRDYFDLSDFQRQM